MKAIVVYESLWDNTAVIARAIAEGIGPNPYKRLDRYINLYHTIV